jgi:hypothetical protein
LSVGVYAYCLGQPGHPEPPAILGVRDASVVAETAAGFTVWLSQLDRMPAADLEGVRRHNEVVEAAARAETPLPFRFGQWFATRQDLEKSLLERREQLTRQLLHVQGALEHGVRVLDPAHHDTAADRSSGTAYLEALARRSRQDEVDAERGRAVAA